MTPKQELFQTQIKLQKLRNSWWRFLPCNKKKIKALEHHIVILNRIIANQKAVDLERFHYDYDEFINSIQEYTTKFRKN
jgi:hypothetical protein